MMSKQYMMILEEEHLEAFRRVMPMVGCVEVMGLATQINGGYNVLVMLPGGSDGQRDKGSAEGEQGAGEEVKEFTETR